MTESRTITPDWVPTFTTDIKHAGYVDDEPWFVDAPNPKLWEGLPAYRAEVELPDDQIVPDETHPEPPDDIKTDPVPEDDPATSPVDPEE